MATEISRTFDLQHGAVVVGVQDQFGNTSMHTLYVTGANAVSNVDAAVTALLTQVTADAAALRTAMLAAGWTG